MNYRALITNDDGIEAPGLHVLAAAALERGLDVCVYAPDREASGAGAGLAADSPPGQIHVERRYLDGLPGVESYAVTGKPGLIALAAMAGYLGPPPDILLSGVNEGANLGSATLHSGTVGAALVAGEHGARAMAVSLARGSAVQHWATAERIIAAAIPLLTETAAGTVLNVNVPNVAVQALRGFRRASPARGGVQEALARFVAARDGWPAKGTARPDTGHQAESDVALIDAGYATVTPLRLQDTGIQLNPL